MRIAAHGLSIDVPHGWEGRVFRRQNAAPVLHLATFALHEQDGDFGAAATGRMRPDDIFAALVEYRRDGKLQGGRGLFAAQGCPRSLRVTDFSQNQLQVTRRGQLGIQHFFTERERPCCLYVVLRPGHRWPHQLVADINRVLATLRFAPASR